VGRADKKRLKRSFGWDDLGVVALPPKISNVKLSRIEHAKDRGGCTICYPHGVETTNATAKKNKRTWKLYRHTQYRPRDV
jgi:hypothetical protein